MDEHTSDDELEALLGRALASADPVPPAVHDGALAAFAFRDLDASVALLVAQETAVVRDADGSGMLVFASDGVEVALDLTGTRGVGQIAPEGAWQAHVEGPGAEDVPLVVDEDGRFAVDLPTGPRRIVIEAPDGSVYRTDWFGV